MDSEILDIVDENDQVIGQETREACHNNPAFIHRCTHFTLLDNKTGKLLLTLRPQGKKEGGGQYIFAGEHVLAGETFEMALIRGVQEEFGFTPTTWRTIGKQRFTYDQQSEIGKMFVVEWNGEPLKWDQKDFENLQWVTAQLDEFLQFNIGPITRFWIEEILNQ